MKSEFALPEAEVTRRWQALQDAMRQAGFEALLLTSERNVEYVTGLRTPAWLIKSRPIAVLIPVQGDPIPVVPNGIAPDVEGLGFFSSVRIYRGFEPEAVSELISVIAGEGLERARIGVESGHEQRLGLPLNEYERLGTALPSADLIDGADVIWSARMVKSELEVERLTRAAHITGEVYDALFAVMDEEWTERRVYTEFAAGCIDRGADAPGYVTMTGGPGHYSMTSSRTYDRRFQPGELFWMDGGCVYGSYFCDYTRCAAFRPASPLQRDVYKRLYEVFGHTLDAVRAGAPASAVFAAATKAAAASDLELVIPTRVGHGVGLDITEPPSLATGETIDLQGRMVLAVEVGVMTDEGWFHMEDNVVVREGGHDFISYRPAAELPVLPRRGVDG